MKKYKLKRWYPSLDSCWEVGDIAYYYRNGVYWNGTRVVENGVSAKEVENNPDFWELMGDASKCEAGCVSFCDRPIKHHKDCVNYIEDFYPSITKKELEEALFKVLEKKKPLFTTEDGVKIFDFELERCYYVNDKLEKTNSFINWFTVENLAKGIKVFFHESNADEYIWRNKPLFSYEDFIRWGNVPYQRVIEQFAKERAKE